MHIFSVRTLTQALKDVLEGEFPFVWVRGQVSNVSRPPSGHLYFSLKDEDSTLNVVWFKGAQPRNDGSERVNPLTGEVESGQPLHLTDDMEVLVAGRMTVYPPRGNYQLVAELVQGQGLGELAVAFEAMKSKLAAKGYFDADRKMILPRNPHRVAVVTALQGAALQDFVRISQDRGFGTTIRVYPSLVQGEAAPAQIAAALDRADRENWAQVIVLIRGGGSLEDLWAFNTEIVAEAIFRARLPVLTGVGHEVDTCIADLVADQRAATPSHAAQLLWTERAVLQRQADELFLALARSMNGFLDRQTAVMERQTQNLFWHSPARRIERCGFELGRLDGRLRHAAQGMLTSKVVASSRLEERLHRAFGLARLMLLGTDLERVHTALGQAGRKFVHKHAENVQAYSATLAALDPQAPLARGYALVRNEQGALVRSCQEVQAGQGICVQVADGDFMAEVKA